MPDCSPKQNMKVKLFPKTRNMQYFFLKQYKSVSYQFNFMYIYIFKMTSLQKALFKKANIQNQGSLRA